MSKRAGTLIVLLASGLAVAGCAPVVTAPTSSPAAESTSQPSAAATPTPSVDPDILFTITATATATGSNGAIVDLVETVYAPTPMTGRQATDTASLTSQCSGWQKQYPSPVFLVATSTATLRTGSPAWPAKVTPIAVSIDGLAPTAWSGDYSPFEAECASPLVKVPGQIRGVEVLPANAAADSSKGWAKSRYGFGAAVDGPEDQIPKKDRITINNCAITTGAAAAADPIASKWSTAIANQSFANEACFVGVGD